MANRMRCVLLPSLILLSAAPALARGPLPQSQAARRGADPGFVFALVVTSPDDERKAAVAVASIRKFGGRYANAPVYVAVSDPKLTGSRLEPFNVIRLPLEMDSAARGYPYAEKVYAAAQVEALTAGSATTMMWLDVSALIVAPPAPFDLTGRQVVALRPVHLPNVGQPEGSTVDAFWERIYREAGADPAKAPIVETTAEGKRLRYYVNCAMIAYSPSRGICREWARVFSLLVRDRAYQKAACADTLHKVFLHQAVVSAVILAKSRPSEWRWLPAEAAYALNLHARMPAERRIRTLNTAIGLIYDSLWDTNPDWMDGVTVDEPLAGWLREAQRSLYRVADRLYREENSCNSYLVETGSGVVVIDPGGSDVPASTLRWVAGTRPVQAVLLTHGHEDHRGGMAPWTKGGQVPVVAQREVVEFIRYHDRLAGFFARRNTAQTGVVTPAPTGPVETTVEATVLFGDSHVQTAGDLRFELTHVGGETPDTSVIWIPQLKAAFLGDNYYQSFPNLYTLRGTKPRWALGYIAGLERALALEPEILLPGHGEPVVGRDAVRQALTGYRDAIRHVHDAVVEGMNAGKSVYTLMREITLPPGSPFGQFYGRVSWSVRGIYEAYAGWFDENPVTMYDEPASSVHPEVVKLAGGADAIVARARQLVSEGRLVQALHLCDIVRSADPRHAGMREVRLSALRGLQAQTRNGIERRWLESAIREQEGGVRK